MKIATAWSTESNTLNALEDAFRNLGEDLSGSPSLVVVQFTDTYDSQALASRLKNLAGSGMVLGCTSCKGVMTQEGFHSGDGTALGLWGLHDPDGSYGVGAVDIGEDARGAAAKAVEMALDASNRPGEIPSLIWLNAAPGQEERILQGIADVVGESVPVLGGSAGDNAIAGNWSQIAGDQVLEDGVVLATLFPSGETSHAFQSGYVPTEHKGKVTRAEGRIIHEIDGRPAAVVYNEWTGGIVSGLLPDGGSILVLTTLNPLGYEVGKVGNIPYYNLSHPEGITTDGALSLFSEVVEGVELTLMTGSLESLTSRAGRVAASAVTAGGFDPESISGCLAVYCAGCMLTVGDEMAKVVESINEALHGKPFLGAFTFGEQGCFLDGRNHHGNLMISFVAFN